MSYSKHDFDQWWVDMIHSNQPPDFETEDEARTYFHRQIVGN